METTCAPAEPKAAIEIMSINKDVDGSTTRSYIATVAGICSGVPVGAIDVNDWQKPGGWISWVFVHQDFRRLGIARQLFEHIITDARTLGKTGLGLSVKPENESAQALYHSLGFKVCYTYEAGLLLMTMHL